MYTIQQIKNTLDSKGYKWFTGNKGYDVNIVGVRNSATEGRITNKFDDKITLSYKDLNGNGNFIVLIVLQTLVCTGHKTF